MDEPTADPAIITAYLICREARKQATVLLSGVGGDELFAGYRKHAAHRWGHCVSENARLSSKWNRGRPGCLAELARYGHEGTSAAGERRWLEARSLLQRIASFATALIWMTRRR